jgi:hypothetical protein
MKIFYGSFLLKLLITASAFLLLFACVTPSVVIYEPVIEEPHIFIPPQIGRAYMTIENIDSNRAEILVTVNVGNLNTYVMMSPVIIYDYRLNGNTFIRGRVEGSRQLAASSVTPVEFRLFVNYEDLYRNFRQMRNLNLTEASSLLFLTLEYENDDFIWETVHMEIGGILPLQR